MPFSCSTHQLTGVTQAGFSRAPAVIFAGKTLFLLSLLAPVVSLAQTNDDLPGRLQQWVGPAQSLDANSVKVWVYGPLVELYSGPGRGYALIHTLEKGETITLHRQTTDWVAVTAANGTKGWIRADALPKLIDAEGRRLQASAPNDQMTTGRWWIGSSMGIYDSSNQVRAWLGYQIGPRLRIEAEGSHITENDLRGQSLIGQLRYELGQFGKYEPSVAIGFGVLETNLRINGVTEFDTMKSSVQVRRRIFNDLFITAAYGREVVLTGEIGNYHIDSFHLGVSTHF